MLINRKPVPCRHCKRLEKRSCARLAAANMQFLTETLSKTQRRDYLPWSPLVAICCGFILQACVSQGQPLNSERIEQAFGSYGVDVIQSSNEGRVASLYSGSGGNKVTRTFAVVRYAGRVRPAYASEHSQVAAGQSLGAVFKAAGWGIEKHNIFVGELEIPATYSLLAELMHIGLPQHLATHVYLLVIRKDDRSYNYATITELHHPDYLSAEDLNRTYGEIIFDDSNRTSIDDYIDPEIWRN